VEGLGRDVYVDAGGFPQGASPGIRQQAQRPAVPEPLTDLQKLAQQATGEVLPIFGHELFKTPPSTFAPADQIPASPEYIVGPGDEVLLRIWGHTNQNLSLTVDRSGSIYVPKLGAVDVAGLHFRDLESHLKQELSRTYRNFDLSVNLGKLRSIRVFVLGEAYSPGSYTISSLSTVFNALLASGGPTTQGSLRNVQLRRGAELISTLDLYDFLLRGDRSKDVVLQSGDVIFIPFVGPQVAISGSVKHPAIYEVRDGSTVGDVLRNAGGPTSTASESRLAIEGIEDHHERHAFSIALDAAGLATRVVGGSVLHLDPVLGGYKDSVTIRGNLANPGRFAWREGMKLSDIIPDRESLLTNDYWRERNSLGLPAPLFEPIHAPEPAAETLQDAQVETTGAPLAEQQVTASRRLAPAERGIEIKIAVPEIDWSYAVIQRLDPKTLRNSLVPFNLGGLVNDRDASQDLALQPGDVVTILSQRDVQVRQDEQTKYVRLEGEFMKSGVYSVEPGQTLADVVRRAGGLTELAYLYGSSFTRESARVLQQQRLDEYVVTLSRDMNRAAAVRSINATAPTNAASSSPGQTALLDQIRRMRATGRIVLEFQPDSQGLQSIPAIPLEDGDTFRVPARPIIVSVVGSVNGQNVFRYDSSRRVHDYLLLAGKPNRIADRKHAFIIRADGSIYGQGGHAGLWGERFDAAVVYPGDTIVVPEKPVKASSLREVIDWSQVFSQFAIGAASIDVIK
jgi:protein involved in polysaccharide export with SLBB domain